MSKAQAQKHRAVSLDTDENTQSPEQDKLWWQFFRGVFAMNKKIMIFTLAMFLAGCASPIESMTPQQISALSDSQLCYSDGIHRRGEKARQEIQRRNLNCDPDYRYCVESGFSPGTNQFLGCLRMRTQQSYQEALIEQQRQEQNKIEPYKIEPYIMQSPKPSPSPKKTHCSAYDNGPFGSGVDCVEY